MTTQVNTFEKNAKSLKVGTLKTDRLTVGREWITFVPALANHSLHASATSTWKYRIVGTTLHVRGYVTQAGNGTHANAAYTWIIPTGCLIRSYTQDYACGTAMIVGGTTQVQGVVTANDAYSVIVKIPTSASTLGTYGVEAATPVDIRFNTNPLTVGMNFTVELDPTCAALAGNLVP